MKRIFVYIFLFLLSTSFYGCDAIYRLLDRKGAEEKSLIGEIIPFEANDIVYDVQTLLRIYGYNVGEPDGVLGTRTREAIAKFQEHRELEVSRFIDNDTWKELTHFRSLGFVEDGQLNLQYIQLLLKDAGFDIGKVDGQFGPKTTAIVKDFQLKNALVADGKIGYNTLSKLSNLVDDTKQ